jgi:hypothetical protein
VVIARTVGLALPILLQSQVLQAQSLRVLGHVSLTGFPRTALAILFKCLQECVYLGPILPGSIHAKL